MLTHDFLKMSVGTIYVSSKHFISCAMAQAVSKGSGSLPGQSMWDL
jgi:hypothetical protein